MKSTVKDADAEAVVLPLKDPVSVAVGVAVSVALVVAVSDRESVLVALPDAVMLSVSVNAHAGRSTQMPHASASRTEAVGIE